MKLYLAVFFAVAAVSWVAPSAWAANPDAVTYECKYPNAPLDPNTITVSLSGGWIFEAYDDPQAPTKFKMINGKADKYGDVLNLTVTDTTIDIKISNLDPAKADYNSEQRINRATGQTTVTKPMFLGAGQCTKIK